jgi:hypothetical protein
MSNDLPPSQLGVLVTAMIGIHAVRLEEATSSPKPATILQAEGPQSESDLR